MALTLNVCPGAGKLPGICGKGVKMENGEGWAGEQGQSQITLGPEDSRPDLSCVSYAL